MISAQHKCVFVHIPKTAGQSIETFFLASHGLTWEQRSLLLLRHNPDPALGPKRLAHLTATEYTSCGYLDHDNFNSYFKFSFVRNPWDRLVSEFRYRKYCREYSFKEFIVRGMAKRNSKPGTHHHFAPQYEFLHNADGELVVDYVGKFENLQSDFDNVCEKIGIVDSTLPHVNASSIQGSPTGKDVDSVTGKSISREVYTSHYDAETVELVGEMYALDIAAFDYKFIE